MFEIFREDMVVSVGIFGFMGLSLLTRIIIGSLYQTMIRESENMSATEHKLLKQCKCKFANCYQLNMGVSNVSVFVDKFLNRLSCGPFSYDMLYHMSGQSMLLAVICAGIGVYRGIMRGLMLGDILPYYIVSFAGIYLYFSVSAVVDIKSRKRILKVNLVDYLENHLAVRMGVTESDMKMLYGDERVLSDRKRWIGAGESGAKDIGRTVEYMPISNRPSEAPRGAVAFTSSSAQDAHDIQTPAHSSPFQITEEELEALIKEFC